MYNKKITEYEQPQITYINNIYFPGEKIRAWYVDTGHGMDGSKNAIQYGVPYNIFLMTLSKKLYSYKQIYSNYQDIVKNFLKKDLENCINNVFHHFNTFIVHEYDHFIQYRHLGVSNILNSLKIKFDLLQNFEFLYLIDKLMTEGRSTSREFLYLLKIMWCQKQNQGAQEFAKFWCVCKPRLQPDRKLSKEYLVYTVSFFTQMHLLYLWKTDNRINIESFSEDIHKQVISMWLHVCNSGTMKEEYKKIVVDDNDDFWKYFREYVGSFLKVYEGILRKLNYTRCDGKKIFFVNPLISPEEEANKILELINLIFYPTTANEIYRSEFLLDNYISKYAKKTDKIVGNEKRLFDSSSNLCNFSDFHNFKTFIKSKHQHIKKS